MSDAPPQVLILAAGKGTRLKSRKPKVLQCAAGLPLLEHVLRALAGLGAPDVLVVVGHQAEQVEAAFAGRALRFVRQEPQLGTGHALLVARTELRRTGTLVVLSGDVPLVRPETLRRLLERHRAEQAAATLLTARVADPGTYGRVRRGPTGGLLAIVEARDASADELRIDEINAGLYVFDSEPLAAALDGLAPQNAQGEYYLTDVVALLARRGARLAALQLDDASEILGVNTQAELAAVGLRLYARRAAELMAAGVLLEDPGSTRIGADVQVEADALIRPFCLLEGQSVVAAGATIGPFARLENSRVGAGAQILDHCLLRDCVVEAGATIGPFAHLRPETHVGEGAKVGNFVELKKTRLGPGAKAPHLSYLGDAEIGPGANIGAGTITCNYDGAHKHTTRIEAGAFVGSNSTLVAPVTVGAGAYVAAGSTITKDIPADALAVGRSRQVIKEDWARKRRGRNAEPS